MWECGAARRCAVRACAANSWKPPGVSTTRWATRVGVQSWGARARVRFFEHPGKVAGAGIMVPSERHENLALATTVVVRRRSAARILVGCRAEKVRFFTTIYFNLRNPGISARRTPTSGETRGIGVQYRRIASVRRRAGLPIEWTICLACVIHVPVLRGLSRRAPSVPERRPALAD